MTTDFDLLLCRLEAERKHLIEGLEQLKARVHRAGGNPLDEVEVATERLELEKRLTSEKRMRGDLAEVEHALAKFEKGTYGLCDDCGQPIDSARLGALPQANLCLNCKAQEEKKAKTPPARQGDSGRKNTAYKESKAYSYYSVAALLEYYERVWKDEQKAS